MGDRGREELERPLQGESNQRRGEGEREIPIAKLGTSSGVKGWQRLYLLTDFPEQFKPGAKFKSDRVELEIEKVDLKRGLVKFKGVNSPEEAKKLTNRHLYRSLSESRRELELEEGEYFWFDLIGKEVWSGEELIGVVKEIERLNDHDYLFIQVDRRWVEKGYPKRIVLEYRRHVDRVELEEGRIYSQFAREQLESLK
jgi:16S rRNA processing protein RimM